VSPLAKGLFHRGIAQSAWVTATNYARLKQSTATFASAEALGGQWAKKVLGVTDGDHTLEALLALGLEEIVTNTGEDYPAAVTVDDWLIPDPSRQVFARGEQQDVLLIVGTNADEGTIFVDYLPFKTPETYTAALAGWYGDHAEQVLALYPAGDATEVFQARNQLISDTWFLQASIGMLDGMDKVSSNAYQYYFSRRSTAMPVLGAHHGMEIGYVFNRMRPHQQNAVDQALSSAMIQYWIQFARTGDPNVEGLPTWPPYRAGDRRYLDLGDEIRVGKNLRKQAIDTLNVAGLPSPAEPRRLQRSN
jgi:para-nitrobenzyl esterase